MSTAKVFLSLHKIANAYLSKLDTMNDTRFKQAPSTGGWSYSEVYAHIWKASILTLGTMEDCIHGKGKIKPTAFVVKLILFFGALPPVRYKVPKILGGLEQVISKTEASGLIAEFLKRLELDYKHIEKANPLIKTKHPNMGYLNAKQWLRFIEIHLKHHLKQLNRIEKSL